MRELHGPAGPVDAWINGQPVYSDGTLGEPIEQPEVPADGVRAPGSGASGTVIPLGARRPAIRSWRDLDEWLQGRIAELSADVSDPGTVRQIGTAAHDRSVGRTAALHDVRWAIAPLVEERGSTDDAYREAGFDELEPLMQRLADGDR